MKIAFLSDYFYPKIGGIEKHIEELSESLIKLGHNVTVITSRKREDFDDYKFNFNVIRIEELNPFKNPTNVPKYYEKLMEVIESEEFDIIHGHHAFTPTPLFGIDIGKRLKIPSFLTAHSLSYGYSNKKLLRVLSFFLKPLSNYYNNAEKLFAVSDAVKEFMKNFLENNAQEDKVVTLYNGVNTSKFDMFRSRREEIRDKLVFLDDEVNYVFVGRLVLRKGIHILIDAFRELISYIPRAKLIVIGDGYLKYWLKQTIKASILLKDKVIYLGAVDERTKIEYLVAGDVLVVPSIDAEAFGIVALEGMAAGVPVIATRIGGLKEVVDDKKTGILVEPNNCHSLATAMYLLGRNSSLRKDLGMRGIITAKEKFDWNVIVRKLLAFYRQAILS